ncbi:MAG: sulfite exporter TauE/SafE family protein [Bacteroidia bacterium]
MIILTAFLTGLFGSFHCAGMCGPIALALPSTGNAVHEKIFSRLIYNVGRIFTYAFFGALFGALGTGLKLAGLQQSISIGAGIIIIISVLPSGKFSSGFSLKFFSNNIFGKLFQNKNLISMFAIGLLNGLLPCGFVYIALVGSLATQDIFQGSLFMFFFGLGTLPMMFSVSLIGQFLSIKIRSRINKFVPVFAVFIGCLFIIRGMNLGIPYLSPKISQNAAQVKECCKPE